MREKCDRALKPTYPPVLDSGDTDQVTLDIDLLGRSPIRSPDQRTEIKHSVFSGCELILPVWVSVTVK